MPRIRIIAFSLSLSLAIVFPACKDNVNKINLELLAAAKKGDTATVQALLDKGVDVNMKDASGNTALMVAARFGQTTTVQALLDRGAEVNAKGGLMGFTALMWAVHGGYTAIVQALLDRGADTTVKDMAGGTALMKATVSARLDIIELLEQAEARE